MPPKKKYDSQSSHEPPKKKRRMHRRSTLDSQHRPRSPPLFNGRSSTGRVPSCCRAMIANVHTWLKAFKEGTRFPGSKDRHPSMSDVLAATAEATGVGRSTVASLLAGITKTGLVPASPKKKGMQKVTTRIRYPKGRPKKSIKYAPMFKEGVKYRTMELWKEREHVNPTILARLPIGLASKGSTISNQENSYRSTRSTATLITCMPPCVKLGLNRGETASLERGSHLWMMLCEGN